MKILRQRRPSFCNEVKATPTSPFEALLGGRPLAPVFHEMFLLPSDASHEAMVEGTMDRIWSVRWIRPLLRLLARWDVLFPETGVDVPTTMHIFCGKDRRGRLCHHWNRTFHLGNVIRRFNAHLLWEPTKGWVAERTGPGRRLEAAWHLEVKSPNVVEVIGSVKALYLGRFRIPIPRPMQLDAIAIDTAHLDEESTFHCDLVMSSPVFGSLFGYHGTFRVRRIPPYGEHFDELRNDKHMCLSRHRRWLQGAALYNAAWGSASIIWPNHVLKLLGSPTLEPTAAWQALGMMVAVYAPAYWWASRNPLSRAHIVAVALLGKILGPIGYLWALRKRGLNARFGLTILTNDVLWLLPFARLLREAVSESGGWRKFVGSEQPVDRPETGLSPPG